MQAKTIVKIAGDVSVVVPDSLESLTTYVLKEQEDWFEDEIRFVRRAIGSGELAIDIGANFGVYTLSMGQAVGRCGQVWAFEPASVTASLLAESIALNQFDQIRLAANAVSDHAGMALLSLSEDSEMNQLVNAGSGDQRTESVAVTTLDAAMDQNHWNDISFLKIDAEGQEKSIIDGGARFFERLSPLVQYEAKSGTVFDLALVQRFNELGYASYRLVPSLQILAPFDPAEPIDTYLLNLFCCKPDRARTLSAQGLLVLANQTDASPEHNPGPDTKYSWKQSLVRLPYGKQLSNKWRKRLNSPMGDQIEQALALYRQSCDSEQTMQVRFNALRCSFEMLRTICAQEPVCLRYASLARVAGDFGARDVSITALQLLYSRLIEQPMPDFSEPFLAVSARYDTLDPKYAMDKWLISSVLEGFERAGALSSYYTGKSALPRLNTLKNLGFFSEEMARRIDLIAQRFAD